MCCRICWLGGRRDRFELADCDYCSEYSSGLFAGNYVGFTCSFCLWQRMLRVGARGGQVGPYNNPQETYNYYYLPFCQPKDKGEKPAHKWGGLGEVLQGNQLIDSQLDLKFRSALVLQFCA